MSRPLAGLVRMDAHRAEIAPEARLHERVGSGVYRLARRTQYFVDNGWCCGLRFARADSLHLQSLTARCSLLTVATSTAARARLVSHLRHAHHLLGDVVRLLLILVARLIGLQLGLNHGP